VFLFKSGLFCLLLSLTHKGEEIYLKDKYDTPNAANMSKKLSCLNKEKYCAIEDFSLENFKALHGYENKYKTSVICK
jgi:hypothetical protein